MAAYTKNTVPLMAGDGPNIQSSTAAHPKLMGDSPLQTFVKAKNKINEIFLQIEDYLQDSLTCTERLQQSENIMLRDEAAQLKGYIDQVEAIREVLTRDHMKVAFFGRTSNGKSTVINSMLHERLLPSGIGHTTSCFLQVEGSKNGEAYLCIEGSSDQRNVKLVGQLAHALCKHKLQEHHLVHIFWPKEKCLLLRDDVVLVDSPGIDVTPDLDEWIDRHCHDADVFVLVANAESTLTLTEKKFFHNVSTRLSKPNVFILHNRWDLSAMEPGYIDQVRAQHTERALNFLVNELNVCDGTEASERIFFVSAKEVLQKRLLQQQEGSRAQGGTLAEGFYDRYLEFQEFEKKFEKCISKSAVKTKFGQHSQSGHHITGNVHEVMEGIFQKAKKSCEEISLVKQEMEDKLNFAEQQMQLLTNEIKDKIGLMVEDVNHRVSEALSKEISRLGTLVDEFNLPFHSDKLVLNVYKKELHKYLESGLGSNLRARLSTALIMNIENIQREMTERMSALLPFDRKEMFLNVLPRQRPFEIHYSLKCDNLCADFHEDLEFRFSWGFTSIINRFAGNLNNISQRIPRDIFTVESRKMPMQQFTHPSQSDNWSVWWPIGTQGTVGGLLAAGFVVKTVGWRLILVTGAVYSVFHFYERLRWTNRAKEREFKRQYVAHATKKLKLIVDLTSTSCSHQVQQELSTTFTQLCQELNEVTMAMEFTIKNLDKELRHLEGDSNFADGLRSKATYLMKELQAFESNYVNLKD